jgi:hypothetical protein
MLWSLNVLIFPTASGKDLLILVIFKKLGEVFDILDR